MCVRAYYGGLGACPPQENFEFRSSQIASDAIWDKLSKEHFEDTYLCPVTCKTSEMIYHHGASLSKQQTIDLLLCHGTQQILSLSMFKPKLIAHISS